MSNESPLPLEIARLEATSNDHVMVATELDSVSPNQAASVLPNQAASELPGELESDIVKRACAIVDRKEYAILRSVCKRWRGWVRGFTIDTYAVIVNPKEFSQFLNIIDQVHDFLFRVEDGAIISEFVCWAGHNSVKGKFLLSGEYIDTDARADAVRVNPLELVSTAEFCQTVGGSSVTILRYRNDTDLYLLVSRVGFNNDTTFGGFARKITANADDGSRTSDSIVDINRYVHSFPIDTKCLGAFLKYRVGQGEITFTVERTATMGFIDRRPRVTVRLGSVSRADINQGDYIIHFVRDQVLPDEAFFEGYKYADGIGVMKPRLSGQSLTLLIDKECLTWLIECESYRIELSCMAFAIQK